MANTRKTKADTVDVKALAERLYPYFLRKGADGDDEGAARMSIAAAETFGKVWDHVAPPTAESAAEDGAGDKGSE